MADNDRLERFADLAVRVGANVQPGSGVLLTANTAHLEIARAVVERAYAAGAAWVEVEWSDGTIRLTKPVVVGGQVVEGLKVTFSGGRITDVTATSGTESVRAQLDTDEGARSLGEVSLVDRDSRIAKAGILFHNTLFDENAGCHVAWGQSFPFSVAGGLDKSDEERYEIGLNRSAVHTDVVIGGEGMTVTGTGPAGTVEIIRDDEWVLQT
jgi:aminopeptidase